MGWFARYPHLRRRQLDRQRQRRAEGRCVRCGQRVEERKRDGTVYARCAGCRLENAWHRKLREAGLNTSEARRGSVGFVIEGCEISDAADAAGVDVELRRESFYLREGDEAAEYGYSALVALCAALATVEASGRYREWRERRPREDGR